MIGSGRQYLLNRWAVSKCEYCAAHRRLTSPLAFTSRASYGETQNADNRLRQFSGWRSFGPTTFLGAARSLSASVSGQVSHGDELFCAMTWPPLPVLATEIFPFFFGVISVITRNCGRPFAQWAPRSGHRFLFFFFFFLRDCPEFTSRWKSQSRSDESLAILSLRPAIYGPNYADGN